MNSNTNMKRIFRIPVFALLVVFLLALAAPFVLAAEDAPAVINRPISEFVAAQGTYCFDDGGGGCLLFEPPVQNFLGQNDPVRMKSASVDYAGLANEWIVENGGESLGTRFSGSVKEYPLPDGRARVKVVLKTKRALTWVEDSADFSGPLLFGNKAPEVLAGAAPALCNSTFQITFINTAPGAPLPDLIQLIVAPEPGQEIFKVSARCNVKGLLHAAFGVPEGTMGRAVSRQEAKLIGGVLTFTREDVIVRALD